ncbi:MAG TPA: FeoA family protein [Oligoflexia bacterium]|nr:FeoA family protein [Oligoflexia bacterium]
MTALPLLTISDLRPGEQCRIKNLSRIDDRKFARRLEEMGLTCGATLELSHLAPLGGTIAVRVRSTLIALRTEDAACIEVERTNS